MAWFKSGIILLLLVFIKQSTQISISSETSSSEVSTSEMPSLNQTGCLKTIGQCLRSQPQSLITCAVENTLNNLDCAIASNSTWQLNNFISLKKNSDWKPIEFEGRSDESITDTVMNKVSNLIASRSIQFNIPEEEEEDSSAEDRTKLGSFGGLSNFGGSGKKKSEREIYLFLLFDGEKSLTKFL